MLKWMFFIAYGFWLYSWVFGGILYETLGYILSIILGLWMCLFIYGHKQRTKMFFEIYENLKIAEMKTRGLGDKEEHETEEEAG